MKTIYFLLICILFSGCATSNMTTVLKQKTPYPYGKVMVVTMESNDDFYQLDSSNYTNNIKKSFNKLDNVDFRKQLQKTIAKNLNSPNTTIIESSNLYPVNSEISYTDFLKTVKESGAEAILLINLKGFWNSSSYSVNDNIVSENKSPNALFLGYLIELKGYKTVWTVKSVVNGTVLVGYETLNGNLANSIAKNLAKENYIYANK